LITTVLDYLKRHPEMRVLCIIDRESITAAAKFLICRIDRVAKYEQDLMSSFAKFHYVLGCDFGGHFTLILTPMIFLSGVYYPTTQLPTWLQSLAGILPLGAAVRLVRPLLLGRAPEDPIRDLTILVAYTAVGFYVATVLTRRRLLK